MKCGGFFDVATKEKEITLLEKEMLQTTFWDDQARAKEVVKRINVLKSWTVPYNDISKNFKDLKDFLEEAKVQKDEGLKSELSHELEMLEKKLEELEVKKMLSHELDPKSCFLSINAGAGGTESCDWAEILMRMYERYATKKGWRISIIDKVDGEVAGIKNITLRF